jgi:hypothetical protein
MLTVGLWRRPLWTTSVRLRSGPYPHARLRVGDKPRRYKTGAKGSYDRSRLCTRTTCSVVLYGQPRWHFLT